MDAELLAQFRQRLAFFECRQGHLCLTRRSVIASCSRHRLTPLVRHLLVDSVKPGYHVLHGSNFRVPPLKANGSLRG